MNVNLAGLAVFLLIASTTWNLDYALGGISSSTGLLNIIPFMYTIVNLIWMVSIFVCAGRAKAWRSLVLLLLVTGLWVGTISFEVYISRYWNEKAEKALHDP